MLSSFHHLNVCNWMTSKQKWLESTLTSSVCPISFPYWRKTSQGGWCNDYFLDNDLVDTPARQPYSADLMSCKNSNNDSFQSTVSPLKYCCHSLVFPTSHWVQSLVFSPNLLLPPRPISFFPMLHGPLFWHSVDTCQFLVLPLCLNRRANLIRYWRIQSHICEKSPFIFHARCY